jgi:hypothetical protein
MAFHLCTDERFKRWLRGLEDAKVNAEWDVYDTHIQRLVSRYNDYLSGKGGYVPIHWHIIKAMIWTETGAEIDDWKHAPMQIGVRTDPGMHDLLTNPNRKLVVLSDLWQHFTTAKIKSDPYVNIEAGTSLLFLRMAHFGLVDAPESNKENSSLLLQSKTSYSLQRSHPTILHQTHHPKKVMGIIGWRPFTPAMIFMRYNGGDGCYAHKLGCCLVLIQYLDANGRPKKAS